MNGLETAKREILAECDRDHVGLWWVIKLIRQESARTHGNEQRETLDVLKGLLEEGLILVGQPTVEGDFLVWDTSPIDSIEHMREEWNQLGREPRLGEVAWFTTPRRRADADLTGSREPLPK